MDTIQQQACFVECVAAILYSKPRDIDPIGIQCNHIIQSEAIDYGRIHVFTDQINCCIHHHTLIVSPVVHKHGVPGTCIIDCPLYFRIITGACSPDKKSRRSSDSWSKFYNNNNKTEHHRHNYQGCDHLPIHRRINRQSQINTFRFKPLYSSHKNFSQIYQIPVKKYES